MAFVSGSAWIERSFADGIRKCLAEEFSDLYVFHLRGDIRKNMLSKGAAREGQNVFSSGSMTGISIAVLVKNPKAQQHGQIHFHDIGPDLTTTQKLNIIRDYVSVEGISKAGGWSKITPDENNDWLDQVDRSFDKFMLLGDKRNKDEPLIFEDFSNGLKTQRDAWAYNFSPAKLATNMGRMIEAYNEAVDQVGGQPIDAIKKSVNYDASRISWSEHLFAGVKRRATASLKNGFAAPSLYRPFERSWAFYSAQFNDRRGQMPRIYPDGSRVNSVIQISGKGARSGFSALMANSMPDIQCIDNGQCFPLYFYEETQPDDGLFASSGDQAGGLTRRDAITDDGLAHFQAAYPGEEISKEDLFYYIYGLLHSPDYRERFANNLAKQLPRIPAVTTFADFAAFRDAGRALGDLHVNFETVAPYMVTFKEGDHRLIPEAEATPAKFYRVKKMKFGGKGKEKDRTTVIYNDNITMQNIPLEAYQRVEE